MQTELPNKLHLICGKCLSEQKKMDAQVLGYQRLCVWIEPDGVHVYCLRHEVTLEVIKVDLAEKICAQVQGLMALQNCETKPITEAN